MFLRLAFLALLALCAGCASVEPSGDSVRAYQAALDSTTARKTAALKKGSAEEKAAVARFQDFFATMTAESVRTKTRQVYAEQAWFNDTLKTLTGAAAIEAYFLTTTTNMESMTVRFDDVAESSGDYYFRWVMDVKLKKLRKGETLRSVGVTHVRFDEQGRVVMHQDYWDAAAGLFEHVPMLGGAIRAIKKRL